MSRSARIVLAGFAAVLSLVTIGGPAHAADDLIVRAAIEPATGLTDTQPIRLVIRIEGSEQVSPRIERLPALTNLKIISGPWTSHNFSYVNGRTSSVVTLTYTLLAEGPGPASVPSILVRVGDRAFRTEPIRFEVAKGTTAPPGRSGAGPGGPEPAPRPADSGEEVYLLAELGSPEVYVGEPVLFELTLLASTSVSDLEWASSPSFTNFWVEDIEVRPERERTIRQIGDARYYAWPLVRKILIPTRPGSFTIDPYTAQLAVSRTTGDPFQDFFRSRRGIRVVRKSEPCTVNVRALPEAGRPDDFSGAVGQFEIDAAIDRAEAGVDEAVALTVTVRGRGFLKAVSAPSLDESPQLRIYEPKVTESTETAGGRLQSEKTWEWVLVPLSAGEIRIPEVGFSYFEPTAGQYRRLTPEAMTLAVVGSRARDRRVAGVLRPQRRDIEYIKTRRGPLREGSPRLHQRGWFVALLWAPVALVPIVILAGRRQARLQRDHGLARSRRARSRARKSLASTSRRAAQLDSGTFHEEIARALVDFVADRFNRAPSGLTYDLADQLLAARGVDDELRGRFRRCLERCDFARFVPSSGDGGRREEILAEVAELIDRLEKAL